MNQNKKTGGPAGDLKPGHPEQPLDNEEYVPKTDFGKKLWALREKALAEGMTLMSNEEILAEIEARRYGRPTDRHE